MEQWKSITDYEGLYEVSNTGLVRSLKYGKKRVLSPTRDWGGYLRVNLYKDGNAKRMSVHRLVASAFIPNPLGLSTVNHRDENKLNNEVANLEWLTMAENSRYGTRSLRSGLARRNGLARSKPVLQLDKFGNVVGQFPSAHEAARQTGIVWQGISMACGSRRKTAGGYSWKYA